MMPKTKPTIEQLHDKLNELINSHNDLAYAVNDLCKAVEIMGQSLMTETAPEKLDS